MANPRIGFIGLGLMGHGIAKNLVTKGFPLTVSAHRNRKPLEDLLAAGAKEVATNADVAKASDVVILCVTGAPQVEEIVFGENGIASVARAGMIVIDTSTSEPATTTKTREALAAKVVAFVDAPLSRTPVEAEQGRLNTMSEWRATSALVATSFAPAASRSSSGFRLRWTRTVRG